MAKNKVTITVDKKFFDNIFEKKRREMQQRIGVLNLSQSDFTRLIKDFKLNVPQQKLPKIKRRKNEFTLL